MGPLTRLNGTFGRTVGFVAGKGIIAPPEPFLVPGAQEINKVVAGMSDQLIIPGTQETDCLQVALALAPHPTTPIFVRNITTDHPLRAMLRVNATNANPFFVPTLNMSEPLVLMTGTVDGVQRVMVEPRVTPK